jgi:hypothetical protein
MASALKRLTAVAVAAMTTIAVAASPARAADGNYVWNAGAIGSLGVIHLYDGDYTHENYDQLLPQGQKSNVKFPTWAYTEGFYVGPGYCAHVYQRAGTSGSWGTKFVFEGGGLPFWASSHLVNYMVVPFHKQPGLSCYAGPA